MKFTEYELNQLAAEVLKIFLQSPPQSMYVTLLGINISTL
jgi:hypothetical protein